MNSIDRRQVYEGMTSTEEKTLLARTVVQPKLGALALVAVLATSLSFAMAWLIVDALAEGGLVAWIIGPIGALGLLGFGWIAWWSISRRANREPAVIIDEVGLFDNVSIAAAGRVRWADIERVWLCEGPLGPFLCISPRPLGAYLAQKNDLRAIAMRVNLAIFGSPVAISLWTLDMQGEDVWARVAEFAAPAQPAAPGLCR